MSEYAARRSKLATLPRGQMDGDLQTRDSSSPRKDGPDQNVEWDRRSEDEDTVTGPTRDIHWQRRSQDVPTATGPMQDVDWHRRSDEDANKADFEWYKRQEAAAHCGKPATMPRGQTGDNLQDRDSPLKGDTGPDRDIVWDRPLEDENTAMGRMQDIDWQRRSDEAEYKPDVDWTRRREGAERLAKLAAMPRGQIDGASRIRDSSSFVKDEKGPNRDIDWQRRSGDVPAATTGATRDFDWSRRSDDVKKADFEWSKRQATRSSDSGSLHREGRPDGFIMVDRSASPEIAGFDGRNRKREESNIIWEFLPKDQSRVGRKDEASHIS